MDGIDEIVQEFLVESHENLDQLDRDFVALEAEPDSRDLLASVFRTIHTIKGTSGFLAFGNLERVTHVGENLLAKLRDGVLRLDKPTTDVLLRMVDAVRELLTEIERTGSDAGVDVSGVADALRAALDGPGAPLPVAGSSPAAGSSPVAGASPVPAPAAAVEDVSDASDDDGRRASEPPAAERAAGAAPGGHQPGAAQARPEGAGDAGGTHDPEDPEGPETPQDPEDPQDPEAVADLEAVEDPEAAPAGEPAAGPVPAASEQAAPAPDQPAAAAAPSGETAQRKRSAVDGSIRVDVDVLENLMQLVGELVLSRNQILQQATDSEDVDLTRAAHRLDLISSSLQEAVMQTRMQPMDYLWAKLPRVVRDLAAQCGKEVALVMEGRETELDRTLLDAVKDPLTHLVRNCIDHGIEPPEEREAAGKSRQGTVTLRAYHESGHVVMEIGDDGKGIDAERIGRSAVEKGVVSASELAAMSRDEVVDLIFRPGFSTAATVTNVSGRGVGMDVVRTNIERIGGTVDLTSNRGQGTVFRVTIPLTLAIIPALVVRQGQQRYAIPQANLIELVRMDADDATRGVEYVAGVPVHRLRGRLLPLLDLAEQLDVEQVGRGTSATVAVLRTDGHDFGLVVDEVLDTQEIVVKPLGAMLSTLPIFTGAAVMGDGAIALIIDVAGLAGAGKVSSNTALVNGSLSSDDIVLDSEASAVTSLLVVRTGGHRNSAIPLDKVSRLEETDSSSLERVGSSTVLQYRGDLLPIVEVDYGGGWDVPPQGGAPTEESTSVTIVVYQHGEQQVGLLVEEILDIVQVPLVLSKVGLRAGSLGTLVVEGRITDVLDIAVLASSLESSYAH